MNRDSFTYSGSPSRVVFGFGSVGRLTEEVDRLGVKKVLILSTPNQVGDAERLREILGRRAVGVYDGAVMHVPIETAREARRMAAELGADCAIAIGGGSTIGLGKAIALDSRLPIVAIPTTYAGSEMTPIYGLTENGVKKTGRDFRVLPKVVLYDPDLSVGLPPAVSIPSGINAIAHAAEALYAFDGNSVTSLMAEEGIRAMASALDTLRDDPRSRTAHWDAMYATWLCGSVLGQVSMGLHHKLCHTLGGSFDLPHAQTHAIMLPHTMAYNSEAATEAMEGLSRALGVGNGPQGLYDLLLRLGVPTALRQIGMPAGGLDQVAELAMSAPYPNPRPLKHEGIRALLQRAFDGAPPVA